MTTYDEAGEGGFASILHWHLVNGTRPGDHKGVGKPKPWSNKEFGGALRQTFDERSVRNWRQGFVVPRILDHIELALFGEAPDDQSLVWRADLRTAYAKAKKPVQLGSEERELKVEWTPEGPRVSGNGTVIPPSEMAALLDLWFRAFDDILPLEQAKRGADRTAAREATKVLATIQACHETFGSAITESDVRELETELGRKADLFYRFMDKTDFDARRSEQPDIVRDHQPPAEIDREYPASVSVDLSAGSVASYLRRAASGDRDALLELGACYCLGIRNPDDADKPHLQGKHRTVSVSAAMVGVGDSFRRRDQNFERAFHWYELAANRGHQDAQFALGCLYRDGQGVDRNVVKADEWFRAAAAQGSSDAAEALKDLMGPGTDPERLSYVTSKMKSFAETARSIFDECKQGESFERAEQRLRYWKRDVLFFLNMNIPIDEVTVFANLGSTVGGGTNTEHIKSSFAAHLAFIEGLIALIESGGSPYYVNLSEYPSGKPVPRPTSFTWRPRTDGSISV